MAEGWQPSSRDPFGCSGFEGRWLQPVTLLKVAWLKIGDTVRAGPWSVGQVADRLWSASTGNR
jgi:hypothetical protein